RAHAVTGTVTELCRRRDEAVPRQHCLGAGAYRESMGRQPRVQAPDEIFHVGAKGNRACQIYADDYERRVFLTLLAKHAKRHGWIVFTYALMTKHYHLLLRLRSCSLSAGMCELNGEFSRFTSVRHGLE